MARIIRIVDVADEAMVSLMTVSWALNHRSDDSPDTRQRVQEVILSLGYRQDGSPAA